jgi:hypothetical protein
MTRYCKRIALLALFALVVPACGGGSDTTIITNGALESGSLLFLTTASTLLNTSSGDPTNILHGVAIGGLQVGESMVAIDYRPANKKLYGLSDQFRLYTIDPETGLATAVSATPIAGLTAQANSFDFNPTVDRIRIVSNTGSSWRVNPDTALLVATDTSINPGGIEIGELAYSNNVAGAATTTLYGIDVTSDQLVILNPPNAGTATPVGPLGAAASTGLTGFDISPTGIAYLVVQGGLLNRVNLSTGAATLIGNVGSGSAVRSIAVIP